MVKQKKSIVLMARVLVLALLIGVFASVPSEQTFAAANKALRSKVVFNGDKESDAAWMNNNYVMQAGYKKASKIKKNMSLEEKITDAEECNRQLMKEMNQSQIKRRSIWE